MPEPICTTIDQSWRLVSAAARHTDQLTNVDREIAFALEGERLQPVAIDDPDAEILWRPSEGWSGLSAERDGSDALLDLYLPICSATIARPVTVAHLGQSLDGFIAMHSGESQWVTGPEDVLHTHRLRALCDAVVIGAGTVAADDPQLTTRLVPGLNPLRVVLDPRRRLGDHHRVFTDESAETVYLCARSLIRSGERTFGRACVVGIDDDPGGTDVGGVLRILRERGCVKVLVEGGGVTVSAFLEASLIDRLHITIAPLLIGDGRPAIRFPARQMLGECHRPRYRVFRIGGDVLFDCEIGPHGADEVAPGDPVSASSISRII